MLRVLTVWLALVLSAPAATGQEVVDPNADIQATIERQFDAFRAGDVAEAWRYASPNIQRLFRTEENFARMVEQGYPMVWAPGEVAFIDLQRLGGMLVQRVQVIDGDGNAHYLGYAMVQTEGGWRINGVQILRAPGLGV
jgi:hypothetical protein